MYQPACVDAQRMHLYFNGLAHKGAFTLTNKLYLAKKDQNNEHIEDDMAKLKGFFPVHVLWKLENQYLLDMPNA